MPREHDADNPNELTSLVPAAKAGSPVFQELMENQRSTSDSLKRLESSVGDLVKGVGSIDEALRGDRSGRSPGLFARADRFEDVAKDHEGRLIHVEEAQASHAQAIADGKAETKKNADALTELKDAKKDGFSRQWGVFILVASAFISFASNLIFKLADYLMKGSPHG